jgi:hypothetical protein
MTTGTLLRMVLLADIAALSDDGVHVTTVSRLRLRNRVRRMRRRGIAREGMPRFDGEQAMPA